LNPRTLDTPATLHLGSLVTLNTDLVPRLLDAYPRDPEITALRDNVRSGAVDCDQPLALDTHGLLHDTAMGYPRPYVPNDPAVHTLLLHEVHDAAGHFGVAKTLDLLSRQFFWPGMRHTVETYVSSCEQCQRNKTLNTKQQGLLQPIDTLPERWHTLTMDLITGLPLTKSGKDAIVVFVDKFTKLAIYAAVTKDIDAPALARVFYDHVYRRGGLPAAIITDRDPRFTGAFWQTLFSLCGTKLKMSTAYHPQTDGQTERANRTLVESLRTYTNSRHNDWDTHLSLIEFSYNNTANASTGQTPFFLAHGRHPRTPLSLTSLKPTPNPAVNAFAAELSATHAAADAALRAAQARQKRFADRRRRDATFAVGDLVLLSTANLALTKRGLSGKLHPRYVGPFPIVARVSPVSFRLDLPPAYGAVHPVFHAHLLRSHTPSDPLRFPGRVADTRPPPLDRDSTGAAYEIEAVLDAAMLKLARPPYRATQHYLVKWRGYPMSDCTWEPHFHLKPPHAGVDAWQCVLDFRARQQSSAAATGIEGDADSQGGGL
jgi:hypothetical protein